MEMLHPICLIYRSGPLENTPEPVNGVGSNSKERGGNENVDLISLDLPSPPPTRKSQTVVLGIEPLSPRKCGGSRQRGVHSWCMFVDCRVLRRGPKRYVV